MAQKHFCKDCSNHSTFAIPEKITEEIYEFAKYRLLPLIKDRIVCLYTNKTKPVNHS